MASLLALCGICIGSFPALPRTSGIKSPFLCRHPNHLGRFQPLLFHKSSTVKQKRIRTRLVLSEKQSDTANDLSKIEDQTVSQLVGSTEASADPETEAESRKLERSRQRQGERLIYLLAAMASSTGITSLAAGSVYCRFVWQMQGNGEAPVIEMLGTFSLAIGAAVGMEFWARWAHRALWHASLWNMHESHHRPREGPFEYNDVFAIINAVPAISLMAYGFFNTGLLAGLCFGAGLGITIFGIAYMFVHDGLVHRRFPVGPIADIPYFQKVASAHQLHHADLFDGVPYGLFLGPKELQEVGGLEQLEKILKARTKAESLSDTH
ncbi:hypothetical protein O6H91_15G052500 [Diphasiastrum complanatum]|uniref:Uncharacterized protein n=1 Tax=Diphasiastrum complanatum TaxID=34168 RepID=A0ACC2BI69_DIPCM|nr:hypothetical protein O6H91_15G052500 [Diphasiastrum complanatum]